MGRYSVLKILVKPRLEGMRLISGSCPPSKPRRMLPPDRDFWPLLPRPEVWP